MSRKAEKVVQHLCRPCVWLVPGMEAPPRTARGGGVHWRSAVSLTPVVSMRCRAVLLDLEEKRHVADMALREQVRSVPACSYAFTPPPTPPCSPKRCRGPAADGPCSLGNRVHGQATLMADAERLRAQVFERDAQLEQYMSQLASTLSGMSGPSARVSSDQLAPVRKRGFPPGSVSPKFLRR